jgi:hypothetical protein
MAKKIFCIAMIFILLMLSGPEAWACRIFGRRSTSFVTNNSCRVRVLSPVRLSKPVVTKPAPRVVVTPPKIATLKFAPLAPRVPSDFPFIR